MANDAQEARIKQGWDVWNSWRAESQESIDLSGADLRESGITRANLQKANLRGVNLNGASAVDADLRGASLADAFYTPADLRGTNLRSAVFDNETDLSGALLDNHTSLGDIQWNGVDLTVINWDHITRLGDEEGQKVFPDISVRAYRQVATQLRAQGMNEYADHFAYRARVCRRKSLRKQRKISAWLWSHFLDRLAGYGYYPGRVFVIYALILSGFAITYFITAQSRHVQMSMLGALVFSITSFHGRGFLPGITAGLDDPLVVLAAAEAILGLFIEASFIATFTDRYFGDR